MSDQEFWSLIEALSEPARAFTVSDNLVSNESLIAERIRWLRPMGGVYVGVGPEQNFSYIAGLRPAMAFIVDISGDTAIHRVGDYVRARADVIDVFYGSNVGVYLTNQQMRAFCVNLATLPAAPHAWFIESNSMRSLTSKLSDCSREAK